MGFKVKQTLSGGGEGGSMTAGDILTLLKTVDGTGSGLDSDYLRGKTPLQIVSENLVESDPNVSALVKTISTALDILNIIKTVDGTGSGLDADLVRGVNPSIFLTSETDPNVPAFAKGLTSANDVLTAIKTVDGSGSGLDSDLFQGLTPSQVVAANESATATRLTTSRTITATGDASYSVSFDGSANVSSALTLATVNSNIGSFGSSSSIPAITVNAKGQITAVSTNSIGNELIALQALADTAGFLKKVSDGVYSVDTSTYLTTNQSITISGDASGSGSTAISLTLANSGVTAGTYNALATQVRPFTIDAKGRITGVGTPVTITPAWSSITSKPTTLSGFGITDAQPLGNELTALQALTDVSAGFLKKTGDGTYSIDTASYLTGNQTITVLGDATGSGSTAIGLTLANSGVVAGTYNNSPTQITPFTVDSKGRITGVGTAVNIAPLWSSIASKPTTLSGFGITDAQPLDSDLTVLAGLTHTPNYAIFSDGTNWGTRQISATNDLTGTLPIGRGGTGASTFVSGRILFGGGGFGTIPTSTSLFWDNTNKYLGVGAATAPAYTLDIFGGSRISGVALFTNATSSTSTTTGGAVFSGGVAVAENLYVGGYIGSDVAFKVKYLEGTTSDTQGGSTSVAHGVSVSKIISVTAICNYGSNFHITSDYDVNPNRNYGIFVNATSVIIQNHPTNSSEILLKPFRVTIIYMA